MHTTPIWFLIVKMKMKGKEPGEDRSVWEIVFVFLLYFKSVTMIEGWMEFWGGCTFKTTPKDCGDSTSSLYNLRYIHSKIDVKMLKEWWSISGQGMFMKRQRLNAAQIHSLGWSHTSRRMWLLWRPNSSFIKYKQFLNLGSSADVDHLLTLRLFLSNSSQLWSVLWSVGLAPVPDRFIHSTRRAQEDTWAGNPCRPGAGFLAGRGWISACFWIFSRKEMDC